MTLQDSINRIEELLRALKATDPAAQKAWCAVTMPCPMGKFTQYGHQEVCPVWAQTGRVSHDISGWPEGAVQGLLIQVISESSVRHVVLDKLNPSRVGLFGAALLWYSDLEALAAALVGALEARTK